MESGNPWLHMDHWSCMGYSIHIDDAGARATLRFTGRVTASEVVEALLQLTAHADYHADMPRLWDGREAELSAMTRDDFPFLAEALRAIQSSSPGVRVAFLVARDIDFGIMRMFESLEGEDLPANMQVFRDQGEAEAWLMLD